MLGRSGDNVARVLEATGCYPQFSKPGTATSSTKDRMLTLGAPSVVSAASALRMLLDLAAADGQLAAMSVRRPEGARLALRQVVPPNTAGAILGFNGEHLKATAQHTGAPRGVECL